MANENTETSGHDVHDQAAQHTLAANPLVGVRGRDVVASARTLLGRMASNPTVVAQQWLALIGELGRIATGASELAPDPKDKRFADPAWKESFPYRALAQAYLAWAGALNRCVDETKMDKRDAERARFVISLLVDAMSPTNSLAGNPAALKKLVDTGGVSLLQGLENFVGDLARNGGLPAQVDTRKFAVGRNLATTPGSVVYRNSVMELIQYHPMTEAVHARPLLIAPPQINKFYVFDLAPEKSIIQLALKGGLQTFAISWKNPTSAESHFGLDTYVEALEDAADVMRDITGSEDINIWGSCSGGITTSAFLGNLAARGERKVHSATVAVCVLDMAVTQDTTAGMFVTPESIAAAKQASQLAGRRRRTGTRPHVRLDAAQRPDLELLGEQLSARQRTAGLRRALLEQRHHAVAGPAACRLPRPHQHQPLRQCRPARRARCSARHGPGGYRELRGRRRD